MTTCPSYTDFPATCGPCESGGSGETCIGDCGAPINLENGSVRMSRSYLQTAHGDFQMTWFNRFEQNGAAANPTRGVGKNWTSANFAYQMDQGDGTLGFVWDPGRGGKVDFFSENGGGYTACNCSLDTLTDTGSAFRVTTPSGSVTEFDKTSGMIKRQITPGGQATDFTYDSATHRITEQRRTYNEGPNTTVESRQFTYLTSGENQDELQYVTLRRASVANPTSGDWDDIRRVKFECYGASESHGNLGDLKLIKQQVLSGTTWVDDQVEYFRYYKDAAGGKGYQHGLKYNLSPEGYANMAADSLTPETASDSQLAAYASVYYEYDSDRRASKASVNGGDVTYTVAYSENGSLSHYAYNHWLRKAVLTTPDGAAKTVYSNNIGQDLLVDLKHGSDQWISYTKYDDDARVIERVQPSAIDMSGTPYNEAFDNLDVQVKTSAGLINVTTYYARGDTDPTAAPGYPKLQQVKKGSGGTTANGGLVTLSKTEYETHSVGSGATAATVYPLKKRIVYQSAASGGSESVETSFANTFHSGTTQLSKVVENLPNVDSSQNGGSWLSGNTREQHFNLQGQLTKSVDARGTETTYAYDLATGAMTQRVQDAAAGGLQLTTDYEVDELGRTTQSLGPLHNINGNNVRTASWTVYQDEDNEVWTGGGYQLGSNYTLVNPVSITKHDKAGRVVDEIQATRGSGVEDAGKLVESNTFPQSSWTRWTHHEYGDDGRLAHADVYHAIPATGSGASGANYDRTSFAYDSMGRRNKTTSPGGTITKTFYDVRNLVTETQVGTVDGGGSDNMRAVTKNTYDDGADGGDGNLTKVTTPVDDTAVNDRVTEFQYDWRDRQTASIAVESSTREFRSERTLDNLGRATQAEEKRDDNGTLTLIAKSETFYDDRGQVYRSKRYAVSSSGVAGNALTDNAWYDEEGNVLKSKPAGSESFTKHVYDAIGGTTASYTGYYSGSGGDDPDSAANDVIFEESHTTYDAASNVTFATSKERWHDATGNGALNGPTVAASQPKSRDSYTAFWYDGIGRQTATADYGTNDNDGAPSRPNSAPASSDTILVSTTNYDAAGNAEDQTDPAGQVTRSTYDDAGRVTSVVQNHGSTPTEQTDTTYTVDGQLKTLKAINSDTGDQTTSYAYGVTLTNSKIATGDLLHTVTYPDSGVVTYEYNRQGQRIKMTDQNGSVHDYAYDTLGRQTEDKVSTLGTVDVDGFVRRIEWTYDNRNRLEDISSYSATTGGSVRSDVQYEYNDFSQLKTEYQQHGSAVNTGTSPKVEYGYANGSNNTIRRENIAYPDASVLTYGNGSGADDKLSRVEKLSWKGTDVVTYDYLGLGQVVIQKYVEPSTDVEYTLATGSGTNPYAGLDRFGRIIDLQWKQGGAKRVHLQYGYDQASNRTYRRDEVARTNNAKFDELYGYDGLHRLDDFNRGKLNANNNGFDGATTLGQAWTLDATGNWKGFDQTVTGALTQTRTHNTVNEITAISETVGDRWADPAHDANGNMTTIPQPKALDDSYTATWDAWNRLVKLTNDADADKTVAEFEYDGLNRRTVKKPYTGGTLDETRHFYYSDQWQVLEERVDSATTADRQFVWGVRYVDDLVLRDKGSERLYALQDALFNVVAITDDAGAVKERFAYQPYGQSEELDPDFSSYSGTDYRWEYRFTGRELDLETELQINRRRYLHLQLGRWMTRDKREYEDLMSLYAYANSNALTYSDPFGLVVPIIPIVIVGSCAACWGVAGIFFNTAHEICKNSQDEQSYLLCFISAIDDMESDLDWYSWSVINAACLACGGGLTGAAKKIGQKMGSKWAKKKAAKEAAEKAAKEKAEKEAKRKLVKECPEELKECLDKCAKHLAACLLTSMADLPEVPGNKGTWPKNRCEHCGLKCIGNCRKPNKGGDKRWPWPSRGDGGGVKKWSRCDYWNWKAVE